MKQLIHSVPSPDGSKYELFAEYADQIRPEGYKVLWFTAVNTNTKGEEDSFTKGMFFLPPEAVNNLKLLLENI